MFRYAAYGFRFEFARALPLFQPATPQEPDFQIAYSRFPDIKASPDEAIRQLTANRSGWTLRYVNQQQDWIDYRYDQSGKRLLVNSNQSWDDCIYPLVSVVFAQMLADIGQSIFHGAGLNIGGKAVILLGGSGHGKSTLAGALIARGATLLTDDLVLMSHGSKQPMVEIGSARLSLLPDAYDALSKHGLDRMPAGLRPDIGKYLIDASGSLERAPLSAALILQKPVSSVNNTRFQKLGQTQAILALMGNRYGTAWLKKDAAADLSNIATLVQQVPVFNIDRPPSFPKLMESCDQIERLVATSS